MSPDRRDDPQQPIQRSTGWVGRGTKEWPWARALSLIAIGTAGLASYKPFYDHDADSRGWDWLPHLVLAFWVGVVAVGIFNLARSFRQ